MPTFETPREQDESLRGSRWVVPGSRLQPTPGAAGLQSGSPPDVGSCSGCGDDQRFQDDGEVIQPSLIDNWIDA